MQEARFHPNLYQPPRSLPAKVKRRITQWRAAKPMTRTPGQAIISFTFDDFPVSAGQYGADILEHHGALGTYYACTGFLGGEGPGVRYYQTDDLASLASRGHEIAAHTQTHLDCARARTEDALGDVDTNLEALTAMGLADPVQNFAYPYGETHFALKTALADRFETCRGILPGINRAGSDLMQLRAVELGDSEAAIARAERAIEAVARSPGWLVFFTHEVQPNATEFGVRPEILERVVKRARDSGALIATASQAMAEINGARI